MEPEEEKAVDGCSRAACKAAGIVGRGKKGDKGKAKGKAKEARKRKNDAGDVNAPAAAKRTRRARVPHNA